MEDKRKLSDKEDEEKTEAEWNAKEKAGQITSKTNEIASEDKERTVAFP